MSARLPHRRHRNARDYLRVRGADAGIIGSPGGRRPERGSAPAIARPIQAVDPGIMPTATLAGCLSLGLARAGLPGRRALAASRSCCSTSSRQRRAPGAQTERSTGAEGKATREAPTVSRRWPAPRQAPARALPHPRRPGAMRIDPCPAATSWSWRRLILRDPAGYLLFGAHRGGKIRDFVGNFYILGKIAKKTSTLWEFMELYQSGM